MPEEEKLTTKGKWTVDLEEHCYTEVTHYISEVELYRCDKLSLSFIQKTGDSRLVVMSRLVMKECMKS